MPALLLRLGIGLLAAGCVFTATGAIAAEKKELPVLDLAPKGPVLSTNPLLLGHNSDPGGWQGAIEWKTPPLFIDAKTGKPDPAWISLTHAFPLHWMRYNWGNNYIWKDTVGPVASRKLVKHDSWNLHYNPIAGLDEFLRWNESLPGPPRVSLIASPMRPVKEVAELVAYCNATTGPMAKLRAANGHPKPYNVLDWELGNESDWAKRGDLNLMRPDTEAEKNAQIRPSDYIEACRRIIKAARAVDPQIHFYAHAKTAPWFVQNPNWPDWHREVLKGLGSEIDGIVIHPYYDGYKVPYIMQAIDTVIADIKTLGPKNRALKVWVSEHARWMDEKDWSQTWGLQGAISTADFLIAAMERPEIGVATYWCYGDSGPWRVFNGGDGAKFGTAIFELYRLLNEINYPKTQPLTVDSHDFKNNPPSYNYTVSATLFIDPKTGRKALLAVNRSPEQSFAVNFPLGTKAPVSVKRITITADKPDATNTPETPDAVRRVEWLSTATPTPDGILKLQLPARSVTAWVMEGTKSGMHTQKGRDFEGQ